MKQQIPAEQAPSAPELGDVLDTVRQSALHLLSGFPAAPSSLRISVGEVSVQADWAAGPPVAAGPAPVRAEAAATRAPAAEAPAEAEPREYVRAPSVGVFYRAPEPGADPFVAEGDPVQPGQQVAIVEAMKLMIPVKADVRGELVEVLKQDGEPVEYDEPLLAVRPSDG